MEILWGDLHNHCGISYGFGSLENALTRAREQLDFCAVTGHANWHDMPEGAKGFEFIEEFHRVGFAKLARAWDDVREAVEAANRPGEFITFQSYEAHSRTHGDHHVLSPSADLPLLESDSPRGLIEAVSPVPAIAVPHHVGYVPGYRGVNWDTYDASVSPVVEVFSKHGCGMSDQAPYPYLHTMGPRDSRTTVRAGMDRGHRFGFVASTDHHAGYPGSYGDGRVAVLAAEKTRDAIWEALLARRVYAVTGDKIACRFTVNGVPMGGTCQSNGGRKVRLSVQGCDALDRIVIYRNSRPWQVVAGESLQPARAASGRCKVRVELGWGPGDEAFRWEAAARVSGGEIVGVEPCFRGRNVLAPTKDGGGDDSVNDLQNRILEETGTDVAWCCETFKNPTTQHPATAAVILEIDGDRATELSVTCNGETVAASLGALARGSRGTHLKEYNSHAFLLHRAIPEEGYTFEGEWEDGQTGHTRDTYDAEVRQVNGQCAWISPVVLAS